MKHLQNHHKEKTKHLQNHQEKNLQKSPHTPKKIHRPSPIPANLPVSAASFHRLRFLGRCHLTRFIADLELPTRGKKATEVTEAARSCEKLREKRTWRCWVKGDKQKVRSYPIELVVLCKTKVRSSPKATWLGDLAGHFAFCGNL